MHLSAMTAWLTIACKAPLRSKGSRACTQCYLLRRTSQPRPHGLGCYSPPTPCRAASGHPDSCLLNPTDQAGLPGHSPAPTLQHTPQLIVRPVQVYAACGRGRQGTLQVIHSAGVLEELHTSSPPCEGIYRMWPAVMRGLPSGRDGGAPHTLIILSFVNGTRVMAAGGAPCAALRTLDRAVGSGP